MPLRPIGKSLKSGPTPQKRAFAQFCYAQLLQERGQLQKAFDEFQVLVDNFAGRFPKYNDVLAHQFKLAKLIMERRTGEFFVFDGFLAPERAIPLLEKVIQNGPQSRHAPEAQYLIGQAEEHIQEYEES